jgi:hypothetical protein
MGPKSLKRELGGRNRERYLGGQKCNEANFMHVSLSAYLVSCVFEGLHFNFGFNYTVSAIGLVKLQS